MTTVDLSQINETEPPQAQYLYVIDTETTGLGFAPHDFILRLAIARLNTLTYRYQIMLDEVIKYKITDHIKSCWLVANDYLSIEAIQQGKPIEEVVQKTQALLEGHSWTCFNIDYDYSQFLELDPFSIKTHPSFCLMQKMTPVTRINARWKQDWKWPKLTEAYSYLYGLEPKDPHTAVGDTKMATAVAVKYLQLQKFTKILSCCIENEIPVKIRYTDRNQHKSIRQLQPKELTRSNTLLQAFDYQKKEDRTYNLTRIDVIQVK